MRQTATIIIALTVILDVLDIVTVGLRIYCRISKRLGMGADDWCLIAGLILSIGLNILCDYVASVTGVGDPTYVPTLDDVVFALKVNFAAENAQIASLGLVKVSLVLYYQRIFVSRGFKLASNILISVLATFTTAIILVNILDKWPVYQQWNPEAPWNVNVGALLLSYVVINAFLDICIVALPLATIRKLQMSKNRKTMLSTIFIFGSACTVVSLFRLYFAVQYVNAPVSESSFFEAPFIYNSLTAILEAPIFIIFNSLLTLGPLYRSRYGPISLFRSLRSLLQSYRSRRSGQSDSAKQSRSRAGADSAGLEIPDADRHPWRLLDDQKKGAQGRDATHRARWELTTPYTSSGAEEQEMETVTGREEGGRVRSESLA